MTLHQWQQLAKPNLGGILHPRPGVLTKDFRELEVDIQHVYSLNDLEEDEPDLSLLAGAHDMGRTWLSRSFHVTDARHASAAAEVCDLRGVGHVTLSWSCLVKRSPDLHINRIHLSCAIVVSCDHSVSTSCVGNMTLSLRNLAVSSSGPNLPQTSPTHTITTCSVLQPSPLAPPFSFR